MGIISTRNNGRKRGKPPNNYLKSLKKKPSKEDWARVVSACVEAIVQDERDVLIAFSYVTKLPSGFPKGIMEGRTLTANIHRIKARKLLAWLRENGHTSITDELIASYRKQVSWMVRGIEGEYGTIEETELD